MKEYQYISIIKIFLIYIIALLPTYFMIFNKKTYSNKRNFFKINCFVIFLEIIIFSLIYLFPKEIVSLFTSKANIRNYMMYSLKILFIASSTTVIHYSIPIYLFKCKEKKYISISLFKLLYIPFIILAFIIFNTKGAFFVIPICDIIYNIFLLYFYKKVN